MLHLVRIGMLGWILLMIRWEHDRRGVWDGDPVTAFPVSVELAGDFFPGAESVTRVLAADPSGLECVDHVLDAQGRQLGKIIQTSPACDAIIGFSGPTNVLIAIGPDAILVGVRIVSSGDTPEHVEQVVHDPDFLPAFDGLAIGAIPMMPRLDVVSGATLTSLTVQESIMRRLHRGMVSLKFPDPLQLKQVQSLFASATRIVPDTPYRSVWRVFDAQGHLLGRVVRTSPTADSLPGYQGPTDALVAFGVDGRAMGMSLGQSYDNQPYVRYVREDTQFLQMFHGLDAEEIAQFGDEAELVEGVSGATMTSRAVAKGVIRSTGQWHDAQIQQAEGNQNALAIAWNAGDFGTAIVILLALLVGMTSLRGNRALRIAFQCVLVVYLGWINGDLVSQAMLFGWAANGIPWENAGGLVMLTLAAFLIPMTTRRNLYCTHLCPHGAAQHLIHQITPSRWRVRLPGWFRKPMRWFPALLLVWCVVVTLLHLGYSLVGIEPFDAWVFQVAGWATITVAVTGLIASLFVPMAYCRFGCPTGNLLNHVRYHSRSDVWTRRDGFALFLVVVATALAIWSP